MAARTFRRRPRDPGKWLARIGCVLLALVGLVPALLALLVRLPWAREQSAELVQRELRAQLGLTARFDLRLELLPPAVVLRGLRVDAADGTPAIAVEKVRVAPRFFSLLGGKLNVGDVELLRPAVKLVIAGGRPINLALRLPASEPAPADAEGFDLKKLPLRSLTVEDARLDLSLEDQGLKLALDELDLDVTAAGGAVDVSLQLANGVVRLRRLVDGKAVFDDDAVCGLLLRAHVDEGGLLVRRLELDARADEDPVAGASPSCKGEATPESAVTLRLSRFRVRETPATPLPTAAGHLQVEGPLRLVKRYVPSAPSFTGAVGLLADVNFPGRPELPEVRGRLLARDVQVDRLRTVVRTLDAKLEAGGGEVRIPEGKVGYADGEVTLKNVRAQVFERGIPVAAEEVGLHKIQFPGLMRDVGITRHTVVKWVLERGAFTDVKGFAFDPDKGGPSLMSDVWVNTEDFELGDRGWDDPLRRRMVSTRKARVKGRFGVEPYGLVFRQMSADFGRSHLEIPVITVGFDDRVEVRVAEGTRFELSELSPLNSLPVGGRLEITGGVCCFRSNPTVEGELRGVGLQMAGLPLADVATAHAVFKPLVLELSRVNARKSHDVPLPGGGFGRSPGSDYTSERIRVDFGRPRGLLVEGNVATKAMDLRDLLDIFLFEKDPRFAEIFGSGAAQAHLRFEAGGANDPCDTGVIAVRARASLGTMSLYGERYDGGEGELDMNWFDRAALERGMEVELRSVKLRKGRGVISGAGAMRQGAALSGHFVAQDIPMAQVDAMGDLGRLVDGSISAAGHVSGTVESPEVDADVRLSPVRIGQKVFPPSAMTVTLVPSKKPTPPESAKRSRCTREIIPKNFDIKEHSKDESKGIYHTNGKLFGEQLLLNDVQTTWQKAKRVSGEIVANNLDLGTLLQLSPSFALSEHPPGGKLTGRLLIDRMDLEKIDQAAVRFSIRDLELNRGSSRVTLKVPKGETSVAGRVDKNTLSLGRMLFGIQTGAGVETSVELGGSVTDLTGEQRLDLEVKLSPIEIGALLAQVPRVEAAGGVLEGSVMIRGSAAAPAARGELRLRDGSLALSGAPISLEDLEVIARVDEQELRIVKAVARAGGGQLQLTARAPLKGLAVSELSAQLEARGVRWPAADGVEMVADASLGTSWTPPTSTGPRRRTRVTGSVTLQSFLYTRPIGVAADLDALARKGKRTEVDVYDPEDDLLDLSIRVFSPRPLVFRNNLMEADVSLESSLLLTGTNQRFGLQGLLRLNPGGRLRLRANEFDIRQGTIRFDDPLRIAPRVDLQASTEYRRVATSASASGPGAAGVASAGGGGGTAAAGGLWRILMHAYGDADNLKLDLTSDPNLAQEDIILLLTIGMTRAELDQLQAANLGSAAALEALSALSGADRAVKTVIPILDDFRLGSAYSPRTGRTEPTVTVGKRISDQLRANVITGLSENRDVRSNIEWRIMPGMSVLGNYDNLSDVASRGLGNLGADFRVRLEF